MPKTGQDMDTPSLWDRLNASRYRRANQSALDELHQTLSNLERRLVEFQQRHERSSRVQSDHNNIARNASANDRKRNDEDALAEIARRLRQMTDESEDSEALKRASERSSGIFKPRYSEFSQHDADSLATKQAQRFTNIGFLDLLEKLDALADRVDAIAYQQTQPDSALTALINQLDRLARCAVEFVENSAQVDVSDFNGRLEQIESKLVQIEKDNQAKSEQILAEIDRRFISLAQRLDEQTSHQRNSETLAAFDEKLDALAQKLNLDIKSAVQDPSARFEHSDAFRTLDLQIAQIAQLLEQPSTDIQSLKPQLEAIETSLSSTGEMVIVAAREAAQAAADRALIEGAERQSAIEKKLIGELRSLEELSRAVSKQHNENLIAVQTVLSEIGNRLALLENSAGYIDQTHNVEENRAASESRMQQVEIETASEVSESAPASDHETTTNHREQQANLFVESDEEKLPDLHSIVKRVRAQTLDRDIKASDSGKSEKPDVVAIARRSVMRSSIEAKAADTGSSKPTDDEPSKSPDPTHKKRKSILFGFGAALAALVGLQISIALKLNHSNSTTLTTQTERGITERHNDDVDKTSIVGSIKKESTDGAESTRETNKQERSQKAIRVMQQLLQANGYDVGKIDGKLNTQTRSAIGEFRADNGLNPSEVIDDKLVRLLLEKSEAALAN